MDVFEGLQRRLTKLYSDTKESYDIITKEEKVSNRPELIALHLEFRIQREKLTAWGMEWCDDTAAGGSIDEAVARAGLTETVEAVFEKILDILQEAERIDKSGSRTASQEALASEKSRFRKQDTVIRWSVEDRARYEQLAKDLSEAIDLLYDLSRTRRELRQGTYASKSNLDRQSTPPGQPPPTSRPKSLFLSSNYAESEETLVNTSFTRASTGKTAISLDLPSRLDPTLLEIPEEQPPPYDRIGATLSSRMIAYLKQPHFPSSSSDGEQSLIKIPVLVEFAPFDPAYRVTGVPIPTDRLDALLAFYARTSANIDDPSSGSLSCLGYFEDTKNPRFGLVYELPKSVTVAGPSFKSDKEPLSLMKSLQTSSRTQNPRMTNLPPGPPLEERFRMAFNIVLAFHRMHTDERFAHKNVNSANIIFFPKATEDESSTRKAIEYDYRTPYMSSFDLFSEFNLEKLPPTPAHNIYRREDDPMVFDGKCETCAGGSCKCQPYRFDIHGLALVLLEIGMWMPLADFYKSKYTLADFRQRLEHLWIPRLKTKCGTVFGEVVQDMLREANSNITDESQRGLYQRWLTKLRKCCLIDDADDGWVANSLLTLGSSLRSQSSWSPKSSGNVTRAPSIRGPNPQPTALPYAIRESKEEESPDLQRSLPRNTPSQPKANMLSQATDMSTKCEIAAQIIQRAWRSRLDRCNFHATRQKVSTIQNLWRSRKSSRTSSTLASMSNSRRIESDGVLLESSLVQSAASHQSLVQIDHSPVAQSRPKLRVHNVKLQPELLDQWHLEYQPRLERIVERALRNSPESASIELHMVGETAQTAKPTVFINCTSTSRVRGALARKWTYDPAVLDIKVRRGKIRRSKATRTRQPSPPHRSMVNGNSSEQMPLNPFHQQRPLCGASIGAFVGKHLPPVSFGGIVDVDGEMYGMTVHHLLDDPSEDEEEEDDYEDDADAGALRSSGRRNDFQGLDDMIGGIGGHPTLNRSSTDEIFPFEISDEEDFNEDFNDDDSDDDTGYSSEEQLDSSELTDATLGDVGGIIAGSRPDITVTQPALDDVDEDFFPCEEDKDEDHLDSHTLGHVYASSGIKRWNRKGVVHEIDWALLKLEENRLQPCNLIQGGKRYCPKAPEKSDLVARLREPVSRGSYTPDEDEFPTQIAKSDELSNLKVHCFGRTSGLQGGAIGCAMSSVRIYKRRSFSRSWFVMGDFGIGGDSGAWVIDNEQGRVCGHVLAWCSRTSIAYICPAEVLLDDMKRTLGANRICLPGSVEEKSTASRLISPSATSLASPGLQRGSSDGIPDISRLGLGEQNPMMGSSLLNGSAVSPRLEMQRLFGGQIAR